MCKSDNMNTSAKYMAALTFATEKHKGQFRTGGDPYITHPIAVAEMLREKNYNEAYQIAGIFHDLLEDTDATEQEIEALGGKEVLETVKLLTKKKGYVMADYVSAIKANPMAKAVKGADRLHNLRCAVLCDESFKKRYIQETLDWYMDLDPDISEAVKELIDTLDSPFVPL